MTVQIVADRGKARNPGATKSPVLPDRSGRDRPRVNCPIRTNPLGSPPRPLAIRRESPSDTRDPVQKFSAEQKRFSRLNDRHASRPSPEAVSQRMYSLSHGGTSSPSGEPTEAARALLVGSEVDSA